MARDKTEKQNGGANLGFEALLWAAADKLRGHMDAAEYKHVVLGLIFLKYISDAFEEVHTKLAYAHSIGLSFLAVGGSKSSASQHEREGHRQR